MNRYTSTILLLCLPLLACEPADPYDAGLDETPGSSTDAGDPGDGDGDGDGDPAGDGDGDGDPGDGDPGDGDGGPWCCDCVKEGCDMWCDDACNAACGF